MKLHFKPGSDENHFLGHCQECDSHYMSMAPMERVESWYYHGQISQDAYEAYMYLWATSVHRYGSAAGGWAEPPTDQAVLEYVDMIKAASGLAT